MDTAINFLKNQLKAIKGTFQPTCVFVGQLSNIESFYVVLDDKKYKCDSCLEAIDLVFQLFFAVDSAYPPLCDTVWLFLQKAAYNIHLPKDALNTSLRVLLGHVEDEKNQA